MPLVSGFVIPLPRMGSANILLLYLLDNVQAMIQ